MKFTTLLPFSASAYALAFDGPLPTPVNDIAYVALDGFTPKPTNPVRALPDLFQRQNASPNPAVCGYLDGDAAFPLTCSASSTCHSLPPSSYFGCCASSPCQPITRCIDSTALASCLSDAACYDDPGAMACSADTAPSCINLFAGSLSHWVCGARATSIAVLASGSQSQSQSGSQSQSQSQSQSEGASVGVSTTQDASKIVQGGLKPTASIDAVQTPSAVSSAGGARHTARAVVRVAAGVLGAAAFGVFL